MARRNAGFGQAVTLFRKRYETVLALQDVSFSIAPGEMVGYIGPNGAGKSSTIKVMSGILTPRQRHLRDRRPLPLAGQEGARRARIGVVFGQRSQLWWDVPVIDSFQLIRDIYRVEPAVLSPQSGRVDRHAGFGEILRTPARTLSLGQRMRCEIAASPAARPGDSVPR